MWGGAHRFSLLLNIMNMEKKRILLFVLIMALLPVVASAQPTYHDSYADYYVMGGYQKLYHPTGVYNVGTIQAEMLYSFWGTRVGLTMGPDYTSFSVFGLLMFAPRFLLEAVEGAEGMIAGPVILAALSAGFLRFPLSDHIEITAGWDALKFTKLKNYNDVIYLTGSLNAGLTVFLGDHFLVNGYYEFNHTHNTAIDLINAIDLFPTINTQPSVLKGHSFGVRVGWMF